MDTQIRSVDDLIIDSIIEREGDMFTDDPLDRGGATKYGITQKSWGAYIDPDKRLFPLSWPAHVRDITEVHARKFYHVMYVAPLNWIEDAPLRELVIDSAVNCGAERVTKWLQRAAMCTVADGVIGPETRRRVHERGAAIIYSLVLIARFKHYAAIVHRDPTQARFIEGWINRACEFI